MAKSMWQLLHNAILGKSPKFGIVTTAESGGRHLPSKWLRQVGVPKALWPVIEKAHYQDIPVTDYRNRAAVSKMFKGLRGGKVYVDVDAQARKGLNNWLIEAAKKHRVSLLNVSKSVKDHVALEDKLRMYNKLLKDYGPSRATVLSGSPKSIRETLRKNPDVFVKERMGFAGSGVQSRSRNLTQAQIEKIIAGRKARNTQYIMQDYRKLMTGPSGKPVEFRVHALGPKTTEVIQRWAPDPRTFNPKTIDAVTRHSNRALRDIVKRHPQYKNFVLALDVAITKKGKPVIMEIQEQSGYMHNPAMPSLPRLVEQATGRSPVVRRAFSRGAYVGGGAALGAAGAYLPANAYAQSQETPKLDTASNTGTAAQGTQT